MPGFSVIIPCFNAAKHLHETIKSVLSQTHQDWELILVDDGSTDDTPDILAYWSALDARVLHVVLPNGGPSRARNHGALRMARGRYIAFLDADDLWTHDRLQKIAIRFDQPDAPTALYSRVSFFDGSPDTVTSVSRPFTRPLQPLDLLAENPVCTMSNVAVSATAFRRSGGFDEKIVHNEDVEWMIRLAAAGGQIEAIDEPLVFYRARETGLSADLEAMQVGWHQACATVRILGIFPSDGELRRAEAIHLRYLARRALRLDRQDGAALRLIWKSIRTSAPGCFSSPYRGAATLAAALIAPLIPAGLRTQMFN